MLVLQLVRWIVHPVLHKNSIQVSYETLLRTAMGIYELRSVVVHKGHAPQAGHYVCYIRAQDNRWYLCDDNQPPQKLLNTASVLCQQAYMLIYERRAGNA